MKNKRSLIASLRRDGLALLCAVGLFILVYQIVFNFRRNIAGSDFAPHIAWAVQMDGRAMLSSFYDGQERLWHVCMNLLNTYVVHNIWSAAAIVTAAADAAAYCIVYGFSVRKTEQPSRRWLLAVVMLCPFLVSSLTLPGHSFYGGRGAVNTWHNPTTIMVRPFAAAVLYMTVDIYERRRQWQSDGPAEKTGGFSFEGGFWAQFRAPVFTRAELVLYPLCLLCSQWSKPSFIQVFAPAIFLFLLIDVIRTKGKLLPFCIKLALAYLPAALLLLRQFGSFFGGLAVGAAQTAAQTAAQAADAVQPAAEDVSGISIYLIQGPWPGFGPVLRSISPTVKTVVLPCAFPLFLLLAAPRQTARCASFRLGLVCVVVGMMEVLLLHETGPRAGHGNMSWGLYLACWLFWTAAAGQFVRLVRGPGVSGRFVLAGGSALLVWHVVCGSFYIQRILQSVQYYF